MKPLLTALLALAGWQAALQAQVACGGAPFGWDRAAGTAEQVPGTTLGPLDAAALAASASAHHGSFRYGVQRMLQADVVLLGEWVDRGDVRIARYRIGSPGALMVSVQFDRWELPQGARVFLYDAERTHFIGGFDRTNRAPDGSMATAVLPGSEVVIEYQVPQGSEPGELRVASITHAYRDLFWSGGGADALRDYDPGYQSAPCHINMACPEAAGWQTEKRAVAMYLRPDGGGCTGTLVNNTQTPGRPFFYSANHCFQPNNAQWVFYFNYEAPACVGTSGPTTETLTGAVLRANEYWKDFLLVELNTAPQDAGYQVYYMGWDRSGNTPQSGSAIHHPLYDVKKLAIDNNASTSYTENGGQTQLWRQYWNTGLVEAVSSGASLLDQNKRVVGHLYDGAQDCGTMTTTPSGFAKFAPAWDGPTSGTRLRDWLDPTSTGAITTNGYQPSASPAVALQVRAMLEGPFDPGAGTMTDELRAGGLVPLTEPYTASGYPHVGGGGETTSAPVLAVTGPNAVVDWVVVELRSAATPAVVVATRSALVQRDGDIVAGDGSTELQITAPAGSYHVAVRHRNHLGIMSANTYALGASATSIDLSALAVNVYGGSGAANTSGGRRVLCAGDVFRNSQLAYTGEDNDRDPILQRVGGTVPTAIVQGYHAEDVNMDGEVRYTGEANDRDIILVNVGGTVPTAVRSAALP